MPRGRNRLVERARRCALLLKQEINESEPADDGRESLLAMDDKALRLGTALLLREILDHINDADQTAEAPSFMLACEGARLRWAEREDEAARRISGYLGLICLNAKLLERRIKNPDPEEQRKADQYCSQLLDHPPTRMAIYSVYDPEAAPLPSRSSTTEEGDSRKPAGKAVELWKELDPDSFRYFKAGTTSCILTCHRREPENQSDFYRELVLKCVLFPWNTIATVARSTADYASLYGKKETPKVEVVVYPEASTANWVLMPFQEGSTLFDYLQLSEDDGASAPHVRIQRAQHVATALVTALGHLAAEPREGQSPPANKHLDLSPSNVILTSSGEARLIDLGVNHLYTRQVGIAEHDDSVYVAPEVKNRGGFLLKADVYSLGIILIESLSGLVPRDGRVPDSVYEMSPVLGMTLEDLIEEDPDKRLLLLPADGDFSYDRLGNYLDEAFESVAKEPIASESRFDRRYARFAPASRELRTQYDKWQSQRKSAKNSDSSYLLFYSLLASIAWWFIAARTSVPEITDFVADFPRLPAWPTAAAVIAFGQGLLAAKYYQSILARLTVRSLPGALARVTEVTMRFMTVVALPTTLFAVIWRPSLWAWLVALGAAVAATTNFLTNVLANRLFDLGRSARLSTVPPADRPLPRGYEQWWWTMLLYALVIAVIAAGLQEGWMHDEGAYVFGLLVINIGIHYISKCVLAGPAIRGGLARSFAAGERLRIMHESGRLETEPWPPRFRQQRVRDERTGSPSPVGSAHAAP
jgi:serine/threonine protein kinase